MPRDLAVILVTWNVRDLVLDALRTLIADLESSGLDTGVWVVDNQSSDGTAQAIREAFPSVNVIEADANLGFGAGNNAAIRALGFRDQPTPNPDGPRAVFLLNPDTRTQSGAIRTLYDALFALPQAGLVGAQLSYEDGGFQHSAFHFPGLLQLLIELYPLPARLHNRLYESSLNGRYPRALYQVGKPFPVDHPLGATMMLRREVIEQTGIFDEQFFMYCEEIDWALRIQQAGWRAFAVPNARIDHLEARSSTQVRPRSLVNLWTSRFKLFRKHYPAWKRTLALLLVRIGMRLKLWDATITPEVREAYQRIVALSYEKS
ncbi:MAG: glycosyltransferase family 2 protein [Anaerolineae bacterium]